MTAAGRRRGPSSELLQLCWFMVGEDDYVIDIMRIKEVINPIPIRMVPRAPTFVEGVIDLRGTIIPIVDLRERLGTPATGGEQSRKYIIVTISGQFVGLVVDSVREVLRIAPEELKAAPEFARAGGALLVGGVCSRDGRLLVLIDLDHLLSDSESAAIGEIHARREALRAEHADVASGEPPAGTADPGDDR